MKKEFIVVDVPDKCKVCSFYYPARDMHTGQYASGCRMLQTVMIHEPEKKPDWCPIRNFPEKDNKNYRSDEYLSRYADGWNACIGCLEDKNAE